MRSKTDGLELVDTAQRLPALKKNPGISTWKVMDKDGKEQWTSFDQVPQPAPTNVLPSMFQPTAEEAAKMHLERWFVADMLFLLVSSDSDDQNCFSPDSIRVLPHHQNTGAFFIAVFHKKGPIGGIDQRAARAEELVLALKKGEKTLEELAKEKPTEAGIEGEKPTAKPKDKRRKERVEAPFVFFEPTEPNVLAIQKYFQLDTFPVHLLLTRNEVERKRQIYFVSEGVRAVMTAENKDQLKMIYAGLKVFARSENTEKECDFRLAQDGLHVVIPHLKAQSIDILEADLVVLMNEDYPFFLSLSAETQAVVEKTRGCFASRLCCLCDLLTLFLSFFIFLILSRIRQLHACL